MVTKIENLRPAAGEPPAVQRPTHGVPVVRSAELLGGSRQLHIEHAGEIYVLRQTSKGKLILTK